MIAFFLAYFLLLFIYIIILLYFFVVLFENGIHAGASDANTLVVYFTYARVLEIFSMQFL